MAADPKKLWAMGNAAFQARRELDPVYDELARFLSPYDVGFTGQYKPGLDVMNNLRDSTGPLAVDRYISIQKQGFSPNGIEWHDYAIAEDPELMRWQPVKEWVGRGTRHVFVNRYAAGARFDMATNLMLRSAAVFGTGIRWRGTEPGGLLFRYKYIPLRECAIISNAYGDIVGLFRRYEWTAEQIVMEWPDAYDRFQDIKTAYDNKSNAMFKLQHSVVQRKLFDPRVGNNLNMPWESVTMLECDQEKILKESGYRSFPYDVHRLTPDGERPYGIGIGHYAVPDAKELQTLVATGTRAAMAAADPTLLISDAFEDEEICTDPGVILRGGLDFRGQRRIAAMERGEQPAYLERHIEQRRNQLLEAFRNDFFQLLKNGPQMTATEVIERARRHDGMIAAHSSQYESDAIGPESAWALDTVLRRRRREIGPPPPELDGKTLIPRYSSPLLRLADSDQAANTLNALQATAQYVRESGDQTVMDILNAPEAFRIIYEGNNVPPIAVRSRQEVVSIQEERARRQAEQDQIQQTSDLAGAAGQASPMVSALANLVQQQDQVAA